MGDELGTGDGHRPTLPPPTDPAAPPRAHLAELRQLIGTDACVDVCVALLLGAPPTDHADAVAYLGGLPSVGVLSGSWAPYWSRVWGARGLLYVWHDKATDAVVRGLDDPAWRVAEMCLKVTARHEVADTADGAVRLLCDELPRVRAAALRALAVVGDTEHADDVARALEDPDPAVRRVAASAAVRMRERLDLR